MTTTEGHDMAEHTPLTDLDLHLIRHRWNLYTDPVNGRDYDTALTSVHDVPDLLAEVDRLRAELDESEQNHEKWVKFVRHELDNLRSERDDLRSELKTAKSTRFENNGVGDVAAHIQAETINDLRLN
jgi:hypothetical protein